MDGDILPEMFRDEYPNEYTEKLNISVAQYEQIQMQGSNLNGEYGVFNDLRMSQMSFDENQLQRDTYCRARGETTYSKRSEV